MFRRLQFRLYRFVHGEDRFDAWPGMEPGSGAVEPVLAPVPPAVRPVATPR